ncbi:GARP-like protein 3 [Giardia lamblia P15]|uniref:GARP-like protein 3 n=1 Tax=Giardia intestinalis (strain P15) TaxID=658858 RepID=E1F8C4_GIAIA|nr:GARP-like protein 3 [Giardia lamblia P15]
MNATSLMTTPLPVTTDMLSTRDLSVLQLGWPIVYQNQGVVQSDLSSMINESAYTFQQLSCIRPLYDNYCDDSTKTPPTALLRPSLGTILVEQPQCTGKFSDPISISTQATNCHKMYYTNSTSNNKDSIKDSGSIVPIESDVSNSEIKEIQAPPENFEQTRCQLYLDLPFNGSFDSAIAPAFRTAFMKEVRAGQILRQGSAVFATNRISNMHTSISLNSFCLAPESTSAPVLNTEGVDVDQVTHRPSLNEVGQLLPTGVYYGDPGFPKMGVVGPLSATDHMGSITMDLLTPSPTSDSIVSMLDNSVIQHSGSAISISSLNGTNFQTVGSHYPSTSMFPYSTALTLTPQIPAYYCPGIIAGQPIQYTVTALGHPIQLQTSLTQSSAQAIVSHGLQPSHSQAYSTRRKPRRVSIPSGEAQSSQTPFYWTREQAELFDQVHHRIGVDRATDKAIWDELRHHIPNLTQRMVQSRLQKRRLAIRKYYKLTPKSQLKRHHVHPEFQTSKEFYPDE